MGKAMHKEEADCTSLITCTAEALDDDVLETLLVSSQQVNMQICVSYAVNREVIDEFPLQNAVNELDLRTLLPLLKKSNMCSELQGEDAFRFQRRLAAWFPHTTVSMHNIN